MSESTVFRSGTEEDNEWMFDLFKRLLKQYIEATWSWDEALQQESFNTSLPIKQFQILSERGKRIGGYHLSEKSDHLMLDMILVEPQQQRMGWGRMMLTHMQQQARESNKPIRLNVLRNNPAVEFHRNAGFEEIDGDENSLKMIWNPQIP